MSGLCRTLGEIYRPEGNMNSVGDASWGLGKIVDSSLGSSNVVRYKTAPDPSSKFCMHLPALPPRSTYFFALSPQP